MKSPCRYGVNFSRVLLQVFSLDASQNVDAAAARRQLQNYLATMSSFRGRALAGGPLAMPPTSRHALDEVRCRTVEMISGAQWCIHSGLSALCLTIAPCAGRHEAQQVPNKDWVRGL